LDDLHGDILSGAVARLSILARVQCLPRPRLPNIAILSGAHVLGSMHGSCLLQSPIRSKHGLAEYLIIVLIDGCSVLSSPSMSFSFAEPRQAGEQAARASDFSREANVKYCQKKLPLPSSWAKDSRDNGWADPKYADLRVRMRMHRPAQLPPAEFDQIPISLLDPILAQVEWDCAFATPSLMDTAFAAIMMHEMSANFSDEVLRKEKCWQMFAQEFRLNFQLGTYRNATTDGSVTVEVVSCNALLANLEVKLDIGSGGGDPRIQNCCYATLAVSRDEMKALRQVSRCPVLLIEVAGPNISLSGFALSQYPSCDQLSQTVSLLWQPRSHLALAAGRIFFALRRAVPALKVIKLSRKLQELLSRTSLHF